MATNNHAIIRYRTIDACLRKTEQSWNWKTLANACADALWEFEQKEKVPSQRTIKGDIQNMRSGKLGYHAPIEYDRKEKTYYYTDTKFSIDHTPLTEKDTTALNSAILILKQFSGRASIEGIENLITHLEEKFKIKKGRQKEIIQFERSLNEPGHQWVNQIYEAIKKKQTLNIRYQPFDKQPYTRIISPYLLKEYNKRWFLFGLEHNDYQSITNLGLDRINKIGDSLQAFRESPDFDGGAYLKDIVGVMRPADRQVETVIIKAYGTQRHYINTKQIHTSQEIVEMTDDYGVFSLQVVPNYELTSRLLGYGRTLEVVSPPWYREEMQEGIEDMNQFYKA